MNEPPKAKKWVAVRHNVAIDQDDSLRTLLQRLEKHTDGICIMTPDEPFDFATFFDDKAEWSRQTFGPGDRYAGVCKHIRKELDEIEANPRDLEEWVDVALLAMDGAMRSAGATGKDFLEAMRAKDAKNRKRQWRDWRTLGDGEVSEHVCEDDEG